MLMKAVLSAKRYVLFPHVFTVISYVPKKGDITLPVIKSYHTIRIHISSFHWVYKLNIYYVPLKI